MSDENPVTPTQLAEQVKLQQHTRTSIMVFGQSGVGKTTIMSEAASPLFDSVLLSNFAGKGPVETTGLGLPKWEHNGGQEILNMIFSQPEGIPTRDRVGDENIYWILDEWGNWDPQVRAAFHGVLSPPAGEHRYLGSHIIGPNVVCGLTTNRREDGAAVGRYSIPECRRSSLFTLVPSAADWWKWADSDPTRAATFVPAFIAYGSSATAKSLHRQHFLGNPEDFNPIKPNSQPSPRAWERVMDLIALQNSNPNVSKSAVRQAVAGWVGSRATSALYAFLGLVKDRPAFEAMKQDPKGYEVPERVDKQFMLASGAMLFATQGVADYGAALHNGKFDWAIDGMARLNAEVAAYGLTTADRRGIKVSERRPELWAEITGS